MYFSKIELIGESHTFKGFLPTVGFPVFYIGVKCALYKNNLGIPRDAIKFELVRAS